MSDSTPPQSPNALPRCGPAASEDSLLNGRVRLLQPAEGYRTAIDPVFLAAAIPAKSNDHILDLGCGVGAAGLCLLARVPGARVSGIDIQKPLADLARENVRLNGWEDRFVVVQGDIANPPNELGDGGFDHIMCNPPYLRRAAARPSDNPMKAMANMEGEVDARLAQWVECALALARPKGSVSFIHRADRLDDLVAALKPKAGAITVFPLWPGVCKAAKRVIVRASKGSAAPAKLCHGLVLHAPDGRYTPEAQAILREAAGLDF